MDTDEIARAFLVPPTTMAQRLVRAKRKIRDAGIPYKVPETNELPARLNAVLTVIYLVFNEGYVATRADNTNWPQIVRLYDLLERMQPSPIVSLNRAVAVAMASGPGPALALIDALAGELDDYHLLHAARADLLRRLGASAAAAESYKRALALVTNDSERRYLERRLREVQPGGVMATIMTDPRSSLHRTASHTVVKCSSSFD